MNAAHLPGISERLIEEHEDVAETALWLTSVVGVLAAGALFGMVRVAAWARVVNQVVGVAAVCAAVSLAYAAYQGGKIRHPEAYPETRLEAARS